MAVVHRICLVNKDRNPLALGIRSVVVQVLETTNEAQARQDALLLVTQQLGPNFREQQLVTCPTCGGDGRGGYGGDTSCGRCYGSKKVLEGL